MLSKCLDHATPAQVVVQILGGHPMEPSHPFLQARMVGVRILDMVDAGQYSDSLAQVDRPVSHAYLPGRQGDGALSSSVGTENRIPGQERLQNRFDLPMVVLRKDRISGRARPVANYQDRDLLPGEPAFGGSPAPFSGPSREPAPLPLIGSQKPGLVGFDDAAFLPGLEIGGQGQESVSPQKGCFRVDPASSGRLPDRLPFVELFQEEKPAVLVMKTRKRRVRQRIEGAFASPAPESRESGRVPPWSDLRVVAMRTSGGSSHQGDHLGDQVFLVPPLDRNLEIMSLRRCHGANSSKISLECRFLHGNHLLNQAYT